MEKNQQKLVTSQVSRRLEKMRPLKVKATGISQWIAYLQGALAMTSTQLAKKLKITTPSLNRLKEREKNGGITLKQLKKIASALECDLIYAFIPKKPLEKIMNENARKKASELLRKVTIQMELENQGLSKSQQKKQLQELIEELMFTKNLWE